MSDVPEGPKRRYFLGDEEIGEATYELLSRPDLGSQLAGRSALVMGRVLSDIAKNWDDPVRRRQ